MAHKGLSLDPVSYYEYYYYFPPDERLVHHRIPGITLE